jgi:hypothetical protein
MRSDVKNIAGRIDSAPARMELPRNPVVCICERDGADESVACVAAPVNTNLKALT